MSLPLDASFEGHSPSSKNTLRDLAQYLEKFDDIEAGIEEMESSFIEGQILPSKANTDLAQLEAKLDKLQCNGVDSVETFQLGSGKDQAKALRKYLTKRAEQLHGKMDELFRTFKEQMQADKLQRCDAPGALPREIVRTCDNGHPLQVMPCSPGRGICDMCEQVVVSTYTYRCKACDYDLCKTCFSNAKLACGESRHSPPMRAHPYWTL
eukprot:gnl/TRDRNA2_/TRDRNA2_70236_c0_seq1.p1 gnl/TRDRNA2_/TRDRNA2_70236_c0~~gnl/TRDRNA2_/TRDRNA2_70236_c0_seq1.p1  ORF type:complete len:209 (+),score=36.73 gnl/TRDRNA2_/TRDRNA2_70236_c0_seq1:24-650(+)